MHRYKKLCYSQEEVYKHILKGVKDIVGMVGITLGPWGRNVLTDKRGTPRITNDGVSIATSIVVKDELEDKAVQAIRESAQKTREMVGDGTTTSTVLVGAITLEGIERVNIGKNPMALKKKIDEECKLVIAELKKMAKPIKTKEEIAVVASVAMENEEMGKVVGEIVEKIGVDGFVNVEEGFTYKTEWDIVEGMKHDGTYAAPDFVTNPETREAIFEDVPVLIFDGKFDEFKHLNYILQVRENILNKDSIVILARDGFSPEMIKKIRQIVIKFGIPILPVKAPSLTPEQMEDIAIFTGGKLFDNQTPETSLEKAGKKEDYGNIDKIVVNRDRFLLIGGKGDLDLIKKRVKVLKEQVKLEMAEPLKNKIKNRIGSMTSGVGIIRVGAVTDVERNYLFKKVENGVHTAQAALEEGVIPGGGLALKKISEKLELTILKEPLKSPYQKIVENATGSKEGKLTIGKEIIDSVKVTRIALENACSLAGLLITCGALMSWAEHDIESTIQSIFSDDALRHSQGWEGEGERQGMP